MVTQSDEGALLSVHANEAPSLAVISRLARELDLTLDGEERLTGAHSMTAFLDERPLDEVLRWTLGSIGLSGRVEGGTLRVLGELPPLASRSQVEEQAEVAWLRALRAAPRHAKADQAEMSLAEIQERRGDLGAAVKHYEYLGESFPESPLAPDALWRAAHHLMEMGEWNRAASQLTELADLDIAHPYHVRARIELARVECALDSPRKALYLLDALEHHWPGENAEDIRARLVVRARALALSRQEIEALRVLDVLKHYPSESDDDFEVLEIRALAFERVGRDADAALAWLEFAKHAQGPQQERALEKAASSALASGDEVGVLLIDAWARDKGAASGLTTTVNAARANLGLFAADPTSLSDSQWLARGEEFVRTGETAEAVRTLEPLYHHRSTFAGGERERLAAALARALGAEGRISYAISVLREIAGTLPEPEARRRLYLIASDIYENAGMVEEALDALQGRL
jgi:tetratricopeptide (TPR) repeat protein